MIPEVIENINHLPKITKCQNCGNNGYTFSIDENFILQSFSCCNHLQKEIPAIKETNCNVFNSWNIDTSKLKLKEDNFDKLSLKIKSLYFKASFKEFYYEKLPQIRKNLKHKKIIENPDNVPICRPVHNFQVTNLHLFNRNAIFLIISDQDRKKFTTTVNDEIIDIPVARSFEGWGKIKFTLIGPIVCDYDKQIFDTCLKLHHEKGFIGLKLTTNLSEIWKAFGNNSKISGSAINSIKRSLQRLSQISITAKSTENKSFWVGRIIDGLKYIETNNKKGSKIEVRFNPDMIPMYLNGSYSTYSFPILQKLSAYPRRIIEFMGTHEGLERKMSLNKWREIIGVNPSVENKSFKRRLKEAMEELKLHSLIDEAEFTKSTTLTSELLYLKVNPTIFNFPVAPPCNYINSST
ncbi:MAG: replication initiation protein [Silvanigrellaceae bacterium]|nr:replication initiation protein [Silvanigrellaceae bacterium]